MDAALKAAEVRLCKLYAPPSETNFGGGLLTGTQSACDAAWCGLCRRSDGSCGTTDGKDVTNGYEFFGYD